MGFCLKTVLQLFSTCPVACLLLLARLPVGVKGFGVGCYAGLSSSVTRRNSVAVGGSTVTPALSSFRNTWAVDRPVGWGTMALGAARDGGGNEHKDKKDQREGTEDSSDAADDDLVSGKGLNGGSMLFCASSFVAFSRFQRCVFSQARG